MLQSARHVRNGTNYSARARERETEYEREREKKRKRERLSETACSDRGGSKASESERGETAREKECELASSRDERARH